VGRDVYDQQDEKLAMGKMQGMQKNKETARCRRATKGGRMKLQSPWSTDIVDNLTISDWDKSLLRLWIWADRLMWFCATVAVFGAVMWIFR